jgi:hypothetical protein
MKRHTDEKGNLLICIKVEVYDVRAIHHMANLKELFKFLHHFVQGVTTSTEFGYVYLIHEECVGRGG